MNLCRVSLLFTALYAIQAIVTEGEPGHALYLLQRGTAAAEKGGDVVMSYTRPGPRLRFTFVSMAAELLVTWKLHVIWGFLVFLAA